MPSDDNDDGCVYQEEDTSRRSAVLGVQHTLADALLLTAMTLQTDERAAHQAQRRVFGGLSAAAAGFPVVVLEDGVVIVGKLQETRSSPLRILT